MALQHHSCEPCDRNAETMVRQHPCASLQAKMEELEQQIQAVEQRIETMQVEKARCQAECEALEQVRVSMLKAFAQRTLSRRWFSGSVMLTCPQL